MQDKNFNREIKYNVEGLTCANCALKIESALNKSEKFKDAHVNFATQKIAFKTNVNTSNLEIKKEVQKISENIENGIRIIDSVSKENKDNEHSEKYEIGKIIFAILFGAIALIMSRYDTLAVLSIVFYIFAYLIAGGNVLIGAGKNILHGKIFDEKFLMSVATIGAFAIKEYPEAVAVMLFYIIGEYFQQRAVHKSRRSINALLKIRPDYANLIKDKNSIRVNPESLNVNDLILIKPGEKVPVDGKVIKGSSDLDLSSLTGESLPKFIKMGDEIMSGSVNLSGALTVEVTKLFSQSTASKIIEMIEKASEKKAKTENFISTFAAVYTPIVVLLAISISIIPPLVMEGQNFGDWIYKGLLFLVVSCPCALVISIPLGFFGGIAGASKNGILVKGSNFIEALSKTKTVVFDKTGTLTKGSFEVERIVSTSEYTTKEILRTAAIAQFNSNHPIAKSIMASYNELNEKLNNISDFNIKEILGKGIFATDNSDEIIVGNSKLFDEYNIEIPKVTTNNENNIIHVGKNNYHIGFIIISDSIKENSKLAVQKLIHLGIKKIVMLTGDNKAQGEKIASKLGIDEVHTNLLPNDKMDLFEKIKADTKNYGSSIFVGDGINDAPVLMSADVGIAMGAIGSDAAIESSDVVIMDDDPLKVAKAIEIAKKTKQIVWQNILLALGVKFIVLALGAIGLATIWEAVFADVGVALIAVLNASRAIKMK